MNRLTITCTVFTRTFTRPFDSRRVHLRLVWVGGEVCPLRSLLTGCGFHSHAGLVTLQATTKHTCPAFCPILTRCFAPIFIRSLPEQNYFVIFPTFPAYGLVLFKRILHLCTVN